MTTEQADSRLVELAAELKELAASPQHIGRRRLWADFAALKASRPVVNFYMYQSVWEAELAGDTLGSSDPFAREIEAQLAFKLWRAAHLEDDCPAEAAVRITAERPQRAHPFPFGMEMPVERTDDAGSYRVSPPIVDYTDIEKLRAPRYEIDREATAQKVQRVRALIGDTLPVVVMTDELHWGPFEYAVRLRGIGNLLYDVYDSPEFVHRLMGEITDGMISYENEREAAGDVSTDTSPFGHVPYDDAPEGLERRLKGMWAYIHAQSAASLSPGMYEEFIHPYNCRVAELVGRTYYHGCEDLSVKCRSIKTLPGLRLFHISPWTPAAPVLAEMGDGFAYEVHSHPTNVVFGETLEGIETEIKRLEAGVRGVQHVLTLADVETFAGSFDRVAHWARCAQEAAAG